MSKAIKFLVQFRSFFMSNDLLKENEEHANIVTATTMFNLYLICLLTWILTYFNVFKLGTEIMNLVLARTTMLLLIPAIICFILRGKGKWIKHL